MCFRAILVPKLKMSHFVPVSLHIPHIYIYIYITVSNNSGSTEVPKSSKMGLHIGYITSLYHTSACPPSIYMAVLLHFSPFLAILDFFDFWPPVQTPWKCRKSRSNFAEFWQDFKISEIFHQFCITSRSDGKVGVMRVHKNQEISKSVKMCLNNAKQP